MTRHLRTLERLVAEEDIDGVRSRLDRVKHSFDEFEDTHNNYRDTLENEEEIEASDAWFQDMQTTYVAGVKAAKAWLRTRFTRHDKSSSCHQGGFVKFHALARS